MFLLSRRLRVGGPAYSRHMQSWGFAFGVVAGLVVAAGGFLLLVLAALALFRRATELARPENPSLADEDEIDHRFY